MNQYLSLLNPAQAQAVEHRPDVPLQILAGPGSGKTKVLTSRIAHLILHHGIPPSAICAVTFTNKAANEMRERLKKVIGKERTSQVQMGTFHALCALYLRKYSQNVGVETNFTISDVEESKKIVAPLLKQYKEFLEAKGITLKDSTVLSLISKAKSKGQTAAGFLEDARSHAIAASKTTANQNNNPTSDIEQVVAEIFMEYEKTMRKNNSLDFDDLLLYGVKLFTGHKKSVSWCRHVLVDEFQDTNVTQYELMKALAFAKCVTIVGDPDQSIYGWRSAEVGNLSRMKQDFLGTAQIFLEQNYRSTGAILATSLAIIAQDKSRIAKSLHTSHPTGTVPTLLQLDSEYSEAAFIASEIKRLIAHSGGMLHWSDFVILLRFNALSRAIESALQKEGIPNRILGGHKFFERMEIKDLLAYLQLVDNPHFLPAFARAVNIPSRGIGEKTLAEITARADKAQTSHLALVERIHDGRVPDSKPAIKRKLSSFVKTIVTLRELAEGGASPASLITKLLELIGYEDHLRKTEPDWETRWENVQELITFASDVEGEINTVAAKPSDPNSPGLSSQDTPLRLFLQASMLSSEGDNNNKNDENHDKVTISTCHAAKGLEWPVVIVPAAEEGTFPFYRSDDMEEERRLLYVACTRAQSLLYLTNVSQRKIGGMVKPRQLSPFISVVQKQNASLFSEQLSEFPPNELSVMATILSRPQPDPEEAQRRILEFNANRPAVPQYTISIKHVRMPFLHKDHGDTNGANRLMNSFASSASATFTPTSHLYSASATGLPGQKAPGLVTSGALPPVTPMHPISQLSSASSAANRMRPQKVRGLFASGPSSAIAQKWPTNHLSVAASTSGQTTKVEDSPQKAPRLFSPGGEDSGFASTSTIAPKRALAPAFGPSRQQDTSSASVTPQKQAQLPRSIARQWQQDPAVSSRLVAQKTQHSVQPLAASCVGASHHASSSSTTRERMTPIAGPSTCKPQCLSDNLIAVAKSSPPRVVPFATQNQNVVSEPVSSPTMAAVVGVKRRLGVGRATGGYANKKFKPPT